MKRTLAKKILTVVALFALLTQSFSPYVVFSPKAYAQDVTPTATDTITPTPTSAPTATDTITPTPTSAPTPTDTPTVMPTSNPTETPIISPIPTDNLSPPPSNTSNNNQQVQGASVSVTPTPEATTSPTPTPEQSTGKEQLNLTILKNISAPTIDLGTVVSEGSANLTTDKPDYAPTDTALITGSNLLPNIEYSLIVSSSNNPPVNFTVSVTSDDKGVFAYAYQLDGHYRPNYKAELKDSTGAIVATTTFTDSLITVNVSSLLPDWSTGVFSSYQGPTAYSYVSPGSTASYDGRDAAPIYAGITIDPTSHHYEDQGLFAFKPGDTPISTFASQPLTYTFENQYGTAPVWVYIELNKGVSGDTMYQYVPTSNPSGWHTEDAATGTHWQKWTNLTDGIPTGPMLSLTDIATLDSSKTVSRVYLTQGMGDSYHATANGTVAWVDDVIIGSTIYDFVTSSATPSCSGSSSFDSFTNGTVNVQGGWGITGSYDQAIVDNIYGYSSFGCKSLRLSNAITSGSFGDQTFSPAVSTPASESTATNHFEASFDIGSTQATQQPGLFISVSPDNGSGGRMSYVGFDDQSDGIHIIFYDVHQAGACAPSGCANFVSYDVATINRTSAHSIKFSMDLIPGSGNDVVKLYVDGALVKTGTSWEDYYRYDPEQAGSGNVVPTTSKLLFRAGGPAASGTIGKGFLFDNVNLSSTITLPNVTTDAANPITSANATLNGTNGPSAASNTSFWWGTTSGGPFNSCTSCDSQLPSGWSHDSGLGAKSSNESFNESLTSLTPNTTYYFVAWSNVDGTWYPGDVLSFTTSTPPNVTVTIDKFIDGVQATDGSANNSAFPMHASWNATNIGSGTGSYTLSTSGFNSANPYEAVTSNMTSGADYSTNEVTGGSVVGTSCTDGKPYALTGYTTGNTFSTAATGSPSTTVPTFTGITTNKYIIVWNVTCVPTPVNVSPANSSTLTTAAWIKADWTDVTDPALPITYRYESSHASTTNPDGSFVTPVYTSGVLAVSQIPTPGTPEGIYYWHARAVDNAGNKSNWSTPWKVTVDNTAPTVDLVFPTPGPSATSFQAVFSENVNQSDAENPSNYFLHNWPGAGGSGNLSGHATISYDSSTKTSTVTFTTSGWYISPEQEWGVQDIHDLAGNLQSTNPYSEYSTPMVAPTISAAISAGTLGSNGWYTSNVTVHFTCADSGSGVASCPADQVLSTEGSSISSTAQTAIDNAGNTSALSNVVTVKIDKTAPIITVDSLSTTDHTPQLTGTVDDNSASISITIDGITYIGTNNGNGTWTLADNTITPALTDGTYNVLASATDAAGNIGNDSTTNELTISTAAVLGASTGGPGDGLGCATNDCSGNQVGGGATAGQTVLGASTKPQEGNVLGVQTGPEQNEEVLGIATSSASPTPSESPTPVEKTLVLNSTNWFLNYAIFSFIILIIAIIAYLLYRKSRKKYTT